jgi:PBSX family phage terminase large subunit
MAKEPKKTIEINKDALVAEIRRRQAKKVDTAPKFNFNDHCFPAQVEFFKGDGPRFRTAVCSRRAGKTVGIAADAIDTCVKEPGVICLYITLSKRNARNIIWGDIQKIIADYDLKAKVNQVEMSILFDNGSKINIEGAKDRSEVEKYRGWKLRKAYIDECQSFRPYIKDLINEVITPALRDLRGELYLTGTPGPIPTGYFYESSHSPKWHNHKWAAFDNPHLNNLPGLPHYNPKLPERDLEVTLTEERELKGITELDASYRRETFGEWIEDVDSLVYKYNVKSNDYTILPKGEYTYVMGVDIGFNDADAIAVLAYSSEHNKVYLVDEFVKAKQTISELAQAIIEIDNVYGCVKKVIDAGALGKKIQEEIVQRYGINLEAAEKQRKIEFIELMNADMRTGKIKAKANSRFAEDAKLVQWDHDKSTPDKLVVSNMYHSDICDAVLYAYRECRHFLYEKPKSIHHRNSDEYMDLQEDIEAAKMEQSKYDNDFEISEDEMEDYERMISDDDLFY